MKGTDVRVIVNWTAEEIKTFSADPSSMMETQVAAAKVLLTTLIDKLGQANRLYAEEQRNRPPQEPAAAQPIADQGLVSTMVRSNAMTKLKKLDQARLNMNQREFERWLNTADDWVKDQSLPQLARASQASMVETMFDATYWILRACSGAPAPGMPVSSSSFMAQDRCYHPPQNHHSAETQHNRFKTSRHPN